MDVLNILIKLDTWLANANQVFIHDLVTLLIALAAIRYRKDDNKLAIVAVVLVPALLDTLFFDSFLLSGKVSGWAVFLIYAAFDLIVISLILGREWVVKQFLRLEIKVNHAIGDGLLHEQTFMYARHINEYRIIVIFALSILINFFVAAEYPARQYISKDYLYLYYLYTPLKLVLNIALIYFLFTLGNSKAKTIKEL